jgi:hypothetical protein
MGLRALPDEADQRVSNDGLYNQARLSTYMRPGSGEKVQIFSQNFFRRHDMALELLRAIVCGIQWICQSNPIERVGKERAHWFLFVVP